MPSIEECKVKFLSQDEVEQALEEEMSTYVEQDAKV
jgi:hypothetical protein